jgi:hypothetical protein
MHTHILSPIKFSRDMKSSPRYNALAGVVDFPLLALLEKMRNIDRAAPELDKSKIKWNDKFRNIPYDLVLALQSVGRQDISSSYDDGFGKLQSQDI